MSISVVINTRNEEKDIKKAIQSVSKLKAEIVVVDMESVDTTVSIARQLGAKVYQHKLTHYVEPARNFAIEKATGDWIFILDADEQATPQLLSELQRIVKEDSADFVRIPRKNYIFGQWMKHSRWWPDYNIRFFKKGSVVWSDEIHSIPVTNGREYNLAPEEDLAIIHNSYETIEDYLERLNRYSSVQAQELHKRGRTFVYSDLVLKPTSEFLSRYFAGVGYKDGVHGLAVALLQGFSELVVYLKLWQLQGFEKKKLTLLQVTSLITDSQKEVNYWKAHARVSEGGGVSARIKRKFRLQ